MQANTITLPVDLLNNGTPTNEAFNRYNEELNKSTYVGPNHSLQARNKMELYRTLPKRAGNFLGAAKGSVKFTHDITVAGADGADTVVPQIFEVSYSLPVGSTDAEALAFRQRVIAALDHSFMVSFMGIQEI
jgi:hypothetical protein